MFLGDDLFACHPVAKMITDAGDDFIFTYTEADYKTLYDFIDGASSTATRSPPPQYERTLRYRWIEAVPLRDGKDAILVNWIAFEIVDAKGKVKYSMAWVTIPSQGQCRRDRRLRPGAMEDRERELQRAEKQRLRTRTQFRPWPEGFSR